MSVSKKGFTLIELLVVISIIAILTTIGISSYNNAQIFGRDSRRKNDLKSIQQALELYYQKNGSYPQSTPNSDNNYANESCVSNLHLLPGTNHGDGSNSWISCNVGNLAVPTYINQIPVDPVADLGNPIQNNVTGYAYWSGLIQCTGSMSQTSGQYYILAAKLENTNDSTTNKNVTINGSSGYKDCRGSLITDPATLPNVYILTSP